MNLPEIRQFVLQIALKCADISNPCRPWEISRKWSIKVCEEFFRQGDYERQLNLPVTPQFDRYSSSVPKIQIGKDLRLSFLASLQFSLVFSGFCLPFILFFISNP